MDLSPLRWLSELGDRDLIFNQQSQTDAYEQFRTQVAKAALEVGADSYVASENYTSCLSIGFPKSSTLSTLGSSSMYNSNMDCNKTHSNKSQTWNSYTSEQVPYKTMDSFPHVLPVETRDLPHNLKELHSDLKTLAFQQTKRAGTTRKAKPCFSNEHVIAERNRRERLHQLFTTLSEIIPCLKKTDKASLLGMAINYLKQLEAKVKTIEEKQALNMTVDSAVLVENSHFPSNADKNLPNEPLLKIEATINDKTVFLKIHCMTCKKVFVKALSEIEKLHLTLDTTSLMSFSCSSLDISVVAKVEEGFSLSAREVVENLKSALREII